MDPPGQPLHRRLGIDIQVEFGRASLDTAQHKVFDGVVADRTQAQGVLHRAVKHLEIEGLQKPKDLDVFPLDRGSRVARISCQHRAQHILPAIGAVDIAGTQRTSLQIAELVEHEQWVQALGLEMVAVGDNPDRLRSEASFAMMCGVCPIPASSGKTQRHRLNRGGNRQANSALHMVVVCRMRTDERTRAYVARRTLEGLSKREIMRCLKRYVAREIYRVLTAPSSA